jgi:hypothetical protein
MSPLRKYSLAGGLFYLLTFSGFKASAITAGA